MTKTRFNQVKTLRKERNADVIRRMQSGDQLSSFNSYSSWFPPRPIIEKDSKAVKALYGTAPKPLKNVTPSSPSNHVEESTEKPRKLRLA